MCIVHGALAGLIEEHFFWDHPFSLGLSRMAGQPVEHLKVDVKCPLRHQMYMSPLYCLQCQIAALNDACSHLSFIGIHERQDGSYLISENLMSTGADTLQVLNHH